MGWKMPVPAALLLLNRDLATFRVRRVCWIGGGGLWILLYACR